jgi:hypothetical protein
VAGHTCLYFFQRRVTGARGCERSFGRQHLPPRWRPRLAGGLRGGGACVRRRTWRDNESSHLRDRVAGVARVCRMRQRRVEGGGGDTGGK